MDWLEKAWRSANCQNAASEPSGARSWGPICSRDGRGVAPSDHFKAISKNAKRADVEAG
ncbi:hypothetical protein D3C73_1603070 [compost metagenome]